jgi:hypothetical protein
MDEIVNKDEEATPQEMQDVVAEGIDDILGGEPQEKLAADGDSDDEPKEEYGEGEGSKEADVAASSADIGDGAEDGKAKPVELNYEVPEGLNEKSTERFQELANSNKDQASQIDHLAQTLSGVQALMMNTGLSNDEFLDALDMMKTVTSDPVAGIKQLQDTINNIAKTHGLEVPAPQAYDALADHEDLRHAVEDMKMTREGAMEVLQTRTREGYRREEDDQIQKERQAAGEYDETKARAMPQLGAYLTKMQKEDMDWDAKSGLLLEAAEYAAAQLHPSQWLGYMQQENTRITKIARQMGGQRTETPYTGSSHAAGGDREPTSIEEALNQIL